MTWKEIEEKYPEPREDMSDDRERDFIADCFAAYEEEGFAKKFWSPYGDNKEYEGQSFEVIGRCSEDDCHLSALPMWNIKFSDGIAIGAYPEEIIPSEMKENGCPFDDLKQ